VCESEEAFQALFRQLYPKLVARARCEVIDISAQDADDLAADTMCKVAKRRLALSDEEGWRRLAHKILSDEIVNYFRQQERRKARETDLDDEEHHSRAHHRASDTSSRRSRPPEEWVITKENREEFEKACQLLREVDRYIVARCIAGDDFQQIADALGLSIKTVRNRYIQARARLTALLAARQR
jgi:RNA polymerase sigma factor (sigma-70 family)